MQYLYIIYINDLPDVVTSSDTRLFADDSLLYRHIRDEQDVAKLQKDISALEEWESQCQMSFHPEKCTVLRISTSRHTIKESSYFLHGHKLQLVDNSKYLGVTLSLSNDLTWRKHVE